MRYLFLIIGIFFISCTDKNVEVVDKLKPNVETVKKEVVTKEEPVKKGKIEIVESANVSDETLVADERKVMKNIKSDVPTKCAMWSDGCNVCTRTNSRKASCTTYPECHNRVVSCLKWN